MLLGGILMVKIGVSDRQQAPHTEPLLVPSKGLEQERVPSQDSGGYDTQLS